MQFLFELAPVIAFVVAYVLGGIYVATATIMVAMAVMLAVDYLRTRRIPTMHGLSAVLVFVFGAATLILHDKRFIQWKPTVFYWLVSVCLLGSLWIGKQPLLQRLDECGARRPGALQVSRHAPGAGPMWFARCSTCCSASPTSRWRSTRARRPG